MKPLMQTICRFVFLIICSSGMIQSKAQPSNIPPDTLTLNIQEAEATFLKRNLSLIAKHYDIDISRAFALQARYWDNPILNTDQNLYDGKFFRHNEQYGQIYIQLQQLIRTAGKRTRLIQLANDNVLSSEQQFNELMRNLRYLLQTDFNELSRLQSSWKLFNKQLTNLNQLAAGTEAEFTSGNISAKENLRVKALLYSARSDRVNVERQMADLQREMHTLLQLQGDTVLAPSTGDVSIMMDQHLSLRALIDTARHNRPDLQLMLTNLHTQQHNLSYQKALAKPDLNVGIEYDKASNYIPNYWGLTISLPVPLLNRNKGNIKAAEFSVQQAGQMQLQASARAEQEVTAAYKKYTALASLWKQAVPVLDQEYDRMLQNISNSYQERQIGLLE